MPTVRLRPGAQLARRLVADPAELAISCRTRSLRAVAHHLGELSTFETVPTETPAARATSLTPTRIIP